MKSGGIEGTRIALNNIKRDRKFEAIRYSIEKGDIENFKQKKVQNCQYCGTGTC